MLRQFDICEIKGGKTRYAVILQNSYLLDQQTCVVAPLLHSDVYRSAGKLHPTINLDGKPYVIAVELMAAVPRKALGKTVESADHLSDKIKTAFDFLFYGF
ncbi:MAG: CcdB family protein [Beijerinckiaceae bacterium]